MHRLLISNLPNPDLFIYSGEQYPEPLGLFDLIKPVKYIVEPQFQHHDIERVLKQVGYHCDNHLNAYIQQIFGVKKVWEHKLLYEQEQGFKYDYAVRTRPDTIWLRPFTLDMVEPGRISTIHDRAVCCEFMIGPNNEDMDRYFKLYDWIRDHGEVELKPDNSRLFSAHRGGYNSDNIMATYLIDYCGIQLGNADRLPADHKWAHDYYRVMHLHQKGIYDLHSA